MFDKRLCLAGDWGQLDGEGQTVLPPRAPLSMALLSGAGAYLLDNGRVLVLWLGHAVSSEFLLQVRTLHSIGSAAHTKSQQ
jgi:hypothetical protein